MSSSTLPPPSGLFEDGATLSQLRQYLTGKDLKKLRRLNKKIAALVEPALFSIVTAVPHPLSLLGLALFFGKEGSRLSPYVKTLIYDNTCPCALRLISEHLNNTILANLMTASQLQFIENRANDMYNARFRNTSDRQVELDALTRLMGLLPGLQSIKVFEETRLPELVDGYTFPAFYVRHFGYKILSKVNFAKIDFLIFPKLNPTCSEILLTVCESMLISPTSVTLSDSGARQVIWIDANQDLPASTALERFTRISLSCDFPPNKSAACLDNFCLYLGQKLGHLTLVEELDLGLMYCIHPRYNPPRFGKILWERSTVLERFPSRGLGRLRKLTLRHMVIENISFRRFLLNHADILTSLQLRCVRLAIDRKKSLRGILQYSCWVDLLEWMRNNLQLQEFRLRGFLTNGGNQFWRVGGVDTQTAADFRSFGERPADKSPLRDAVEQWVLKRRASCPIARLAIPAGAVDGPRKYMYSNAPFDHYIALVWGREFLADRTFTSGYLQHWVGANRNSPREVKLYWGEVSSRRWGWLIYDLKFQERFDRARLGNYILY